MKLDFHYSDSIYKYSKPTRYSRILTTRYPSTRNRSIITRLGAITTTYLHTQSTLPTQPTYLNYPAYYLPTYTTNMML